MEDALPTQKSTEINQSYDVVSNSLVSKTLGFTTEIGDTKQAGFYPQIKRTCWNNEVNFSVRLQDDNPSTPVISFDKEKVIWAKDNIEAHFYDKGGNDQENGGFEFEVLLKTPISTNILTHTIQTKGLDFYYQPALTEKEKANGAFRPASVEGSYAVYHSTKANNKYKAGKAFHIYRPFAKDAIGTTVWCDLNIDTEKGLLTITIPQDFLNSAVYPILIDPTFGFTSVGGSFQDKGASLQLGACIFTPTEAGTILSISAVWRTFAAGTCGNAIYDDSAGTPNNKLAEDTGNATLVGTSGANAWYTTSISYSFLAATPYWLALWNSDTASQNGYAYDAGSANQTDEITATYETYPNPWGADTFVNRKISIYATYALPPRNLGFNQNNLRPRIFGPGMAR